MAVFTIEEVKKKIEALLTIRELNPNDFSDEDGLADSLAQMFGEDLKPTQLRKVFHTLKALQHEVERKPKDKFDRSQVARLMPTLAYARGRRLIPKDFYDLMKTCLSKEKLETNEDFLRVVEFVEAILAYHKFRHL